MCVCVRMHSFFLIDHSLTHARLPTSTFDAFFYNTTQIRNFAKHLQQDMTKSLRGLPTPLIEAKVSEIYNFSQRLRRYTSLNHLAKAARSTLAKQSNLSQMMQDYRHIDFGAIQEQVNWVCGEGCEAALMDR